MKEIKEDLNKQRHIITVDSRMIQDSKDVNFPQIEL